MIEQRICSPAFFQDRRQALAAALPEEALVLLGAGIPPQRSADQDYDHFANRHFFYLTGIEQANSVLLLHKTKEKLVEQLFILPYDAQKARWVGARLTPEQASCRSNIHDVKTTECWKDVVRTIIDQGQVKNLFTDLRLHNDQAAEFQLFLREDWLKKHKKNLVRHDVAPLILKLRQNKQPEEIALMREAIDLTWSGILELIKAVKEGARECELVAAFNGALTARGCLTPAFPSIVASGENALCLHYLTPFATLAAGEVIQIDVGAVVGGYNADISRAIPVSGKFSARQLDVYQVVRACQETAFATLKPGVTLDTVNTACKVTAAEKLTALGLLEAGASVDQYYWHNVSHHLGLDTHDPIARDVPLEPGCLVTVEPGIYIPEWQLGFRIEDDVLVTADGCEVLSAHLPREAKEIEALWEAAHS